MISPATSLTSVAGIEEWVVWHASHEVLFPLFTTEIISVVRNLSFEYYDAQVYTWGTGVA
jgi:hypothetical protein